MRRVTQVVRDQVRDSLDLVFEVEEQRVKKIVRRVHVYYPGSTQYRSISHDATYPSDHRRGPDHRCIRTRTRDSRWGRWGSSYVHQQSQQPGPRVGQKHLPRAEAGGIPRVVPRGLRCPRPRPVCTGPILARPHPVGAAGVPKAVRELRRAHLYSERLSEYDGDGGARVTGSRPDPDGAIVSSEIIRGSGRGQGDQPIKVDWRLTAYNGGYKISDVIIDGISMAVTGRSELAGVAERNGGQPQAILAVMRQESANSVICWSENGRISCR